MTARDAWIQLNTLTSAEKSLQIRRLIERADARIRTADPFITSVDLLSVADAQSRVKPHGSKESARPRWRPKTPSDRDVDPA